MISSKSDGSSQEKLLVQTCRIIPCAETPARGRATIEGTVAFAADMPRATPPKFALVVVGILLLRALVQ